MARELVVVVEQEQEQELWIGMLTRLFVSAEEEARSEEHRRRPSQKAQLSFSGGTICMSGLTQDTKRVGRWQTWFGCGDLRCRAHNVDAKP